MSKVATRVVNVATNPPWKTRFIDRDGTAKSSLPQPLQNITELGEEGSALTSDTNQPVISFANLLPASSDYKAINRWEVWLAEDTNNMTLDGDLILEHSGLGGTWPLSQARSTSNADPPRLTTGIRGHASMRFDGTSSLQWDLVRKAPLVGQDVFSYIVVSLDATQPLVTTNLMTVMAANGYFMIRSSAQLTPMGFGSQGDASVKGRYSFSESGISDVDVAGKILVLCCLQREGTPNTEPYTLEYWSAGMRSPPQVATVSMLRTATQVALGCLSPGINPLAGDIYEAGWLVVGKDSMADANIASFQKGMCAKYGVDFMPDLAPLHLGASPDNTTTDRNDMVFWNRADDNLTAERWDQKQELKDFSGQDMPLTGTKQTPTKIRAYFDREYAEFDPGEQTDMEGSQYDWTEGSLFPPPSGCSAFMLTTVLQSSDASAFLLAHGGITMLRNNAEDAIQLAISGVALTSTIPVLDKPVLLVATLDYTEQQGHAYYFTEDASEVLQGAATGTLGLVTPALGNLNGNSLFASASIPEWGSWKHGLSEQDVETLRRYIEYRYNIKFADLP